MPASSVSSSSSQDEASEVSSSQATSPLSLINSQGSRSGKRRNKERLKKRYVDLIDELNTKQHELTNHDSVEQIKQYIKQSTTMAGYLTDTKEACYDFKYMRQISEISTDLMAKNSFETKFDPVLFMNRVMSEAPSSSSSTQPDPLTFLSDLGNHLAGFSLQIPDSFRHVDMSEEIPQGESQNQLKERKLPAQRAPRNVTDAVKVVVGTVDDEDLFGDAGSGVATKAVYAYKFELYLTYLAVGSKGYIVCPLFRNVTDAVKVVVGTVDDEDLFGDAGSGVATKDGEKTAETVERFYRALKREAAKYENGDVDFFEMVLDPTSFGRTTENIFYLSFLIRDGHVSLFLDEDKLPMLRPMRQKSNAPSTSQGGQGSEKGKQLVIGLSMGEWEELCKEWDVNEPVFKR